MKTENRQRLYLFVIMVLVAFGVGLLSIYVLYETAFKEQTNELTRIVQSQARIMEAVARFDAEYSSDYPLGSREATLSQIRDAHENFKGFGDTGEFILAELQDDRIVFLLNHRHHETLIPKPIPLSSPLAEPMRRALKGESGSVVALDYRGEMVLAAYEPVAELNFGLVAKIDLSEIRSPFIKAGGIAGLGGLIIVLFGTMAFFRASDPLIRSIRESQERYEMAAKGSRDGLWDRPDISKDAMWWSPEWYNLLGYEDKGIEANYSNFKNLNHPDDLPIMERALKAHFESKIPFIIEYRLKTKSGNYKWYLGKGQATWDENGKPLRMSGSIQDITEKKRLGQELDAHRHHLEELVAERTTALRKARNDAEAANRAKSQFLSTMSHELRTPLNAILGFGDLLKGQHFGELNPKQEGHVGHILTSGQHLLDLINDLLDIAKIDAGALALDLEALSVEENLANAVALMSSQFKKKDIEVKIHIDPAVTTMTGDPRKFKQIMLNLLSNAMKYTPEKSRVDIRAEQGEGHVRISVTDNGIGIKQEDQEKIFDEFIQVDRVRDENLGGTGIGLALTRRLVELHGGEIGVDSAPGKGSTFWFTLPLGSIPEKEAEPEEKEASNQPADSPHLAKRRILVVEDNEANISMMQDALSIGGHQVSVARNGREAIDLAVSEKPELIFMDIRMPVMDGLEATRRLCALPEFATIPIIALTATVGEESKSRVLDAGCTGYLSKPVQISELLEVLDRYL